MYLDFQIWWPIYILLELAKSLIQPRIARCELTLKHFQIYLSRTTDSSLNFSIFHHPFSFPHTKFSIFLFTFLGQHNLHGLEERQLLQGCGRGARAHQGQGGSGGGPPQRGEAGQAAAPPPGRHTH